MLRDEQGCYDIAFPRGLCADSGTRMIQSGAGGEAEGRGSLQPDISETRSLCGGPVC